MIPFSSRKTMIHRITQVLSYIFIMVILITAFGCNFIAEEDDQESLENTQTALSAEQTDLAEESGDDVNATIAAQQATIDAQAAQATQAAMQPPPGTTPLVPPAMPPGTTPMAPVVPPSGDFTQMMQTAAVLLYEDIVAMPSESRYVQKTLKAMGIQSVKDDGNAVGWLKTDMLGSAPGGRPWDLVIIAQEARGTVSGEFYEYLGSLLQQGTSVILEDWNLGNVVEGAIGPTLAKCGVYAYPWWTFTGNINDVVMWPLGIPHPVLSQPNSGLAFTRARDTWLYFGQLGSQMALTGSGDAALLLGTKTQEKYKDGTLAVCMGGKLTVQGFSSHSFEFNTMYPLWENYIYNALQVRLLGGS
jgi:hypothetical protein